MKKSGIYVLGTILVLVGVIFLILAGVDAITYQFDTYAIVDGVVITYQKIIDIVVASVSVLSIVLGFILREIG